jgi:predicted nucleic acid-binding protein
VGVAYVDTSVLLAIAFGQHDPDTLRNRLSGYTRIFSSILLEAEARSAFVRAERPFERSLLAGITWILPDRSLTEEIDAALHAGYLRGADLLHMATALYTARGERGMTFLTLDKRLREVAQALGFKV